VSKFKEMYECVLLARKKWSSYRESCWKNLGSLVNGFAAYCEIPKEQVGFLPLDKEPKEDTIYGLAGAVHLAEDGYWHLGLVITLDPYQRVLIRICLREQDGVVMVKAGDVIKPRQLDLTNENQLKAFYDEIVDSVKRRFTEEPDFDDKPSLKKIGFAANTEE
jgi:hypothetical protein